MRVGSLAISVALAASCGATALAPAGPAPDAAVEWDGGSRSPAHGVVLAEVIQGASSDTFRAFADFAPGSDPFGWNGPVGDHPTAGDCACVQGISTPSPFGLPDAATIRLGDSGGILAEMSPFGVTVTADSTSTTYQGTSDLGSLWYVYPGGYPQVDASAWKPGDVLNMRSSGGSFPPLNVSVTAGGRLTGLSPSLAAAELNISRDSDFTVSWTPDALPGQTVLLALRQVTPNSLIACFCAAPDQAGMLALPASLVALYASDASTCQVEVERLNVSSVDTPIGTVQLVAATAVAGPATVP
ncbi:MAG TPA: hypothetical protein VMT03_12535 [Polyangia bacterium]|nr:hypothetical protein [Polyangia bacterium]